MISSILIEHMINESLIPQPTEYGCPPGTFESLSTCYCEDHCSWETCRLLNPPQNCLTSSPEAVWAWNTKENIWVAQG